jgi:hypothetical protein
MKVLPIDSFTELFDSGDNDMAHRTLSFTPNGTPNYYSMCTEEASAFPVDQAGGTVVNLRDDDYWEVPLEGGHTINFYGVNYDTFYIGSNGYVTFDSGDTHYFEQLAEHFALPRISALFDDLNPSAGGTISYKLLADKAVVTYQNVPEFSQTTTNSFQIEMFYYGRIKITFLNIAAVDGLTGLSDGQGMPTYYNESDLSSYGQCMPIVIAEDFDGDGDVDILDLHIFAENWLRNDCVAPDRCEKTDLNHDGSVNLVDFTTFANHWLEWK